MKPSQEDVSPYVYYTVSELGVVENATILKNVNVKTIGYFKNDRLCGLNLEPSQEAAEYANEIALDLTQQNIDFAPDKLYLILGTLFTVNSVPALAVKKANELELDIENLISYHAHGLAIRERSKHHQDLSNILWKSNNQR